eukprot:CAMPEP_0172735392 /NCGR_PEP_ID=MMETSP1074-20121228/112454_1 /TAXON_ID=2916 /ORGANISM="Ceratium fusus, Strain PA161109" /LENGTH=45 /DNA_ID= /DNA_START= /DNA_END= /DNA_ORIENTATION=
MTTMPDSRVQPSSVLKKERQISAVQRIIVSLNTPNAAMSFLPIAW